jgi:O-antigen ligase
MPIAGPGRAQRAIFSVFLALWTATQLLVVLAPLPDEVRGPIYIWKNLLGALLVAFGLVVWMLNRDSEWTQTFDKKLLVFALCFPFYTFGVGLLGFSDLLQDLAMNLLWVLAFYLVFPVFLSNSSRRELGLQILLWINLPILVLGIMIGMIDDNIYWSAAATSRMVFAFLNPVYYAYSWQILIPIGIWFLIVHRPRWLQRTATTIVLILIPLVFIVLARARGPLLFDGVILLVYYLFGAVQKLQIKLVAVCVFIILILFTLNSDAVFEPDVSSSDAVDALSSGRITIWQQTLQYNYLNAGFFDYLFGLGTFESKGFKFATLDPISLDYRIARPHVDNAYLDLVLQYGVIGLFLFLGPLFVAIRRTMAQWRVSRGIERQISALIFGCWLGVLAQMFVAAIIPSFGNVINIFLFVLMSWSVTIRPHLSAVNQPKQNAKVTLTSQRISRFH